MRTMWKLYKGYLYKVWQVNGAGWCVEVASRRPPRLPGMTAEAAAEFATQEDGEDWARRWVRRMGLRTAQAV